MRRASVLVVLLACGDHHAGPGPQNDAPPPVVDAGLSIGDPISLDEVVPGWEVDSQQEPSVAISDDTFFVAWRANLPDHSAIEAAHFRPDGTRVEAMPAVLGIPGVCGVHAACAADGTCGVLGGQTDAMGNCQLQLVRVRADGSLVDASPVQIATSLNPQIGGHDTGFIVSYDEANATSIVRFGTTGPALAPPSVASTNGGEIGPCDSAGCWLETGDRTFLHIAGDGTTTTLTTPAELDPQEPMIATTGSTFVFSKIAGVQRVTSGGVLLDASPIPIFDGFISMRPHGAIDQAGFVFEMVGKVQRLAFDGSLTTAHPYAIAAEGELACLPTRCLEVGATSTPFGLHVVGTRIDGDTIVDVTTPLALTTAANSQRTPVIADGGDHAVVIWQDERIDGAGPRLATLTTQLSSSTATDAVPILIAAIDGGYIALTRSQLERLDTTGAVQSTTPFVDASGLACGTMSCAVVSRDSIDIGHPLTALLISFGGQRLGSVGMYSGQGGDSPVVARQGDHYVVAYAVQGVIYARVLGDDGSLGAAVQVGVASGAYRIAAMGTLSVLVVAPDPQGLSGATTATLLDENLATVGSITLGDAATIAGIATLDPDHVVIALISITSGLTIRRFGADGADDPITVAAEALNPQAAMTATGVMAVTAYDSSAQAYRLKVLRLHD